MTLQRTFLMWTSAACVLRFGRLSGRQAENIAGMLRLQFDLTTTLSAVCDRCGAPFDLPYKVPFECLLAEELEEDDNDDILLLDNGTVDLSELARETFILNMPSKTLCREDCRGLCSGCGVNLNYEKCRCKKEVDPRLAALAKLWNNKFAVHSA